MCGDYVSLIASGQEYRGSPPHVRGLPLVGGPVLPGDGITPACAGTTCKGDAGCNRWRDHPRMCGDYPVRCPLRRRTWGSPPHVRGLLSLFFGFIIHLGITPACAGTTTPRRTRPPGRWDHPRMCGDYLRKTSLGRGRKGSPPHVRGLPQAGQGRSQISRITPACAGTTSRQCGWCGRV